MSRYRKVIYGNYYSNHVNKGFLDHAGLLNQQAYYYRKELCPFLPANTDAHIVDIGCGFGSFIKAAMDQGYTHVSGIDLSEEQVKIAHELGITAVVHQSSEEFFASGRKVDCIVGVDIIEHFNKDELIDFLQASKSALNPGGKVVFRTPNMDAPLASVYAYADFSHDVFLNKSSAVQLMKSCGFTEVKVLPSLIFNTSPLKEILRKILWNLYVLKLKAVLFASGRTWKEVVFSPNLIITAEL